MLKNKLLGITISGAILLMGSSIAFADTVDVNTPSDEIIPISAPVNEDSSKAFETKFTDIKDHWAYDEIVSLEDKGIWGDLSGEFAPKGIVTGIEFYGYLDKIFEFDAEVDLGFGLEEEVSRMKAAIAIKKSFEAKNIAVIMTQMFPIYEDTEDLAQEETGALSFVFNTGIMKGKADGKFCPDDNITKAELAVILDRTFSTLKNAGPIEELTE